MEKLHYAESNSTQTINVEETSGIWQQIAVYCSCRAGASACPQYHHV